MEKVILCILDGIGYRDEEHGNAFLNAHTPNYNKIYNKYPHSLLEASGKFVGLPDGQMGNSEVGHLNLGTGRLIYQSLPRINKEIKENTLKDNQELLNTIKHVKNNNSTLHLMGLLSDGGVHSHINHLLAIIDIAINNQTKKINLHLFFDGRDTPPESSKKYIEILLKRIKNKPVEIATVSGRYYSMDRDNRYDRVKKAYDVIINKKQTTSKNVEEYIKENHANGITDEFIKPARLVSGTVDDNDGIIVFNFRPDRLRELFYAITNNEFTEFKTKKIKNLKTITMYPISEEALTRPAFTPEKVNNYLGQVLSKNKIKQLRIAETEKYAHVTYFFDGGERIIPPYATHELIQSPPVATYDLKPEMSCNEITEKLLTIMDQYEVIILNYANGDMVGHTGNLAASIKAVETVDNNLGLLYEKSKELGFTMLITADHGNCEYMLNEKNEIVTSHTTFPVPLIVTKENIKLNNGSLSDIAPTILDILKIEKPTEMTGHSLIKVKVE